jgi:hypothetical protein
MEARGRERHRWANRRGRSEREHMSQSVGSKRVSNPFCEIAEQELHVKSLDLTPLPRRFPAPLPRFPPRRYL